MRPFKILIVVSYLFVSLLSCDQEYPEDLKVGVFKTTTELNTVKYMYRSNEYRYIYSEDHPDGKLAKITWNNSGYELEIINKTSDYDSLKQIVVLSEIINENTFSETTSAEGIALEYTTEWTRIDKSPFEKLDALLKEYGIYRTE